jgi:aldehyde:ferredoxin oxidoreductase
MGKGFSERLSVSFDKIDAFNPDNKLIVASGYLTGTGAIAVCRAVLVAKSPLGNIGCANVRGNCGSEVKYAGYDLIIYESSGILHIYNEA